MDLENELDCIQVIHFFVELNPWPCVTLYCLSYTKTNSPIDFGIKPRAWSDQLLVLIFIQGQLIRSQHKQAIYTTGVIRFTILTNGNFPAPVQFLVL